MNVMVAAVGLAAAFVGGYAIAGDGNELLSSCQQAINHMESRGPSNADVGYCYGLVNGVGNTMVTMNAYLLKGERTCFPAGMRNDQGARIVAKYLEEHPASLHRDGAFLAMAAFQNAYPCK